MDTNAPVQPDIDGYPSAVSARRRRLRLVRGALLSIAGLAGLAVLGHWIYERFSHVYIDDARIAADVIAVSSRVAGWVEELHVTEAQRVGKGDVLVTIDSRDAKLRLSEIDARLRSLEAERTRLLAERHMVDRQTGSLASVRESQLKAAEAALEGRRSDLELARTDFERAAKLLDRRVISRQRWEERRTVFRVAEQNWQQARAEVAAASAALIEARAGRERLVVIDRQIGALTHQREELMAQRSRQELDLEDRVIRSPIDGVIDRTFVIPSEYVSSGQWLLMLHDPKKIWVSANVRETDLRHLHVGSTAKVSVDAYPDRDFTGRVVRIGNAATSEFALLPTPNPSGNFTKIQQRLAIKILLDSPDETLRPGMMVEVDVGIRDR